MLIGIRTLREVQETKLRTETQIRLDGENKADLCHTWTPRREEASEMSFNIKRCFHNKVYLDSGLTYNIRLYLTQMDKLNNDNDLKSEVHQINNSLEMLDYNLIEFYTNFWFDRA